MDLEALISRLALGKHLAFEETYKFIKDLKTLGKGFNNTGIEGCAKYYLRFYTQQWTNISVENSCLEEAGFYLTYLKLAS